jgi:hypothetical protein
MDAQRGRRGGHRLMLGEGQGVAQIVPVDVLGVHFEHLIPQCNPATASQPLHFCKANLQVIEL